MKQKILFFIILLCFSINTIAQTDNLIVAVSKFDNYSKVSRLNFMSQGISDAIIYQLQKLKGLTLIERAQFNRVMKELQLSMSGLVNDLIVRKVGKQLSADFMVVGGFEYNPDTKMIRINARVVDVETGVIVDAETVMDNEIYADDLQKSIAEKLKNFFKRKYNLEEKKKRLPVIQRRMTPKTISPQLPPITDYKSFIKSFYIDLHKFSQSNPVNPARNYKEFIKNFFQK